MCESIFEPTTKCESKLRFMRPVAYTLWAKREQTKMYALNVQSMKFEPRSKCVEVKTNEKHKTYALWMSLKKGLSNKNMHYSGANYASCVPLRCGWHKREQTTLRAAHCEFGTKIEQRVKKKKRKKQWKRTRYECHWKKFVQQTYNALKWSKLRFMRPIASLEQKLNSVKNKHLCLYI